MDNRRIRELSHPAARLLLVFLLVEGARDLPVRSLMGLAGFKNSNHYYTARRQLKDFGLLDIDTRVTTTLVTSPPISTAKPNDSSLRSLSSDTPSSDVSIYHLSSEGVKQPVERYELSTVCVPSTDTVPVSTYTVPLSTVGVPDSTYTVPSSTPTVPTSTHTVPGTSTYTVPSTDTVLTLAERCMEADAMDATGPEAQRNTPFQKRRAAQVGLVKEAWVQFFPKAGPLTDTNAKRFLSWCENRAELVHDELEALSTRKIDNPTTYVSRVLERKAKERQYQPAPQPISPAKPSGAYNRGDKGEPIGRDELTPVSAEQLKQMKEMSKAYASLYPTDY